MTKVAQTATATWRNQCHIIKNVGPDTFFKQFFFEGMFFKLFFFTGTKIIFKPKNNLKDQFITNVKLKISLM